MTFVGLIARNIISRPLRAVLTASAVAIGVMAVVALGVLTTSLKETATQILDVMHAWRGTQAKPCYTRGASRP